MNHIKIILFCFFLFATITAQNDVLFINGKAKKIVISESTICLKFKQNVSQTEIENFFKGEIDLKKFEEINPQLKYYKLEIKDEGKIKLIIDKLKSNKLVKYVNSTYQLDGIEIVPTNEFQVQFKSKISLSEIEKFNDKYGIKILRKESGHDFLYTFQLVEKTDKSIVEIANIYYNIFNCEWALPDYFYSLELNYTPNDAYYQHQYYLHNTGQNGGVTDVDIDAPEAWDITKGSASIITAVMDAGGTSTEDIPLNRIVTGKDYTVDPPGNDPTPTGNNAHGIACAGIIAASQNNNVGISGIAPNSKIMFIKIFDEKIPTTAARIASAIDYAWQNGADIISNSWGGGDDIRIEQVINRSLTQGRDPDGSGPLPPKGCVVVAGSGNNGYIVATPANISGVIAVGAIDKNNVLWDYSNIGDELDVVAPSGDAQYVNIIQCSNPTKTQEKRTLGGDVWTTDIGGNIGYNPGTYGECQSPYYTLYDWQSSITPNHNYTANFGGTSAACPQVSGAAALLLSINSNLTSQEVREIINLTADDIFPNGHDVYTGNGRLNVYKALKYTLEKYGGTINQNFTITAGETWNFEPGVEVKFENNSKLIVYGTLNVNGTSTQKVTFNRAGTSGNWQGIEFKSGSSGNITYAKIENGTFGIYGNGAMPNISNCDIKNNSYGIYVKNVGTKNIQTTLVENNYIGLFCNNADPIIEDCKITNNTHGISIISYSSPVFYYNTIKSNTNNGINSYSNSHPYFGESHIPFQENPKPGYNRITNNGNYGLYSNNSTVFMGFNVAGQAMAGYNTIFSNNSYEIYATSGTSVDAMHNYWNTSYPPNGIYTSSSSVNWYNPLYSDPGGGSSLGKQSNTNKGEYEYDPKDINRNDPKELHQLALYHKYSGNYEESIKEFEEIMSDFPETDYAYNSIGEIYDISKRNEKLEIDGYCESQITSSKSSAKVKQGSNDVKIAVYLREGKIKEAEELSNKVIKEYPNTESEKRALFTLFLLSRDNEEKNSDEYLSVLKEKYPNEIETIHAMELSGEEVDWNKLYESNDSKGLGKKTTEQLVEEYELLGNYPNPFNPSTTISYAVPKLSNVSLTIFDMMGKEVKSYIKDGASAGGHNFVWDGTNNNGEKVASGIYIYKFKAISLERDGQLFEQSKKLLLIK